jgi:hypothetical protein
MSDSTRTPPFWRGLVMKSFLSLFAFLPAAAGVSSVGCSLAANLDDLDNGVSDDAAAGGYSQLPNPQQSVADAGWSNDPHLAPDAVAAGPIAADGPESPVDPDLGAAPAPSLDASGVDHSAVVAATTNEPPGTNSRDSVGPPDSALEVQLVDAAPIEGGFERGDSSADGAQTSGWCASHRSQETVDCHDFDEGQPADFGFSSHYFTAHYASVTSTDFASGSPPSALLVSTPLLALGGAPQDEQFNDLLAFHDKVELRFALKIASYDPTAGYVSLFRISYVTGNWGVEFDLEQGGAVFNESISTFAGTTKHTYAAAQPSVLDAWTNVDCVFDLANHTVSLSYDGVSVLANQTIANPNQLAPAIFVQTGLNYLVAPAKPMTIYYDNLLLNTPP